MSATCTNLHLDRDDPIEVRRIPNGVWLIVLGDHNAEAWIYCKDKEHLLQVASEIESAIQQANELEATV